jgi:hypothetical protein
MDRIEQIFGELDQLAADTGPLSGAIRRQLAELKKEIHTPKHAVKVCLLNDLSVEHRSWHAYHPVNAPEYVILNFDKVGNADDDSEERFPDLNDAVAKFIQRAKL